MKLRDKWGYPVEVFKNKPLVNLVRYLIHTSIYQTLRYRKEE